MSTFTLQDPLPDRRVESRGEAARSTGVAVSDYQLDRLTTLDDMDALRDEWQDLERRTEGSFHYFQSYGWCHAWCRTFLDGPATGRRPKLMIYRLRVGGRLAMLWPMMVQRQASGIRLMTMLTDPLGQYANILADRDLVDTELGRQVWQSVRQTPGIDAIQFLRLPTTSFLAEILGDEGHEEQGLQEASYFDFSGFDSFDAVHASLSRNKRKRRKRRRSKLGQLGATGYECVLGKSPRAVELVGQALDMKKEWLDQNGLKSSALYNDLAPRFLANLAGHEGRDGRPPQGSTVHVLTIDDKPVGIEIGMVFGRHYYSYLGAFDWQLRDYSPGSVQIEMTQRWALENGIRIYDLLGDPAAYKAHWTNSVQPLKSVTVSITGPGAVYAALWRARLRPFLKHVASTIGPGGRRAVAGLMSLRSLRMTLKTTGKQDTS